MKEPDVEELEILATLDSHTSTICSCMDCKRVCRVGAKLGVTTANGIVIKVLSKYQQERSDEHNRDICGIIDALVNPLHIRNITDNDNGRLQRLLANQLL